MPQSLLDVLTRIPDPRGLHGCRYPIPSLQAILILATMNS